MTLQELIPQECPISTCSSAVFHVNHSRAADLEKALPIPAELFSLSLPESSEISDLQLFCLKTSERFLSIIKGKPSGKSSLRFLSWGILLNGVCLTQKVGCPKNESASTLPDIIEPTAPEKYFISKNAAAKICARSSEERKDSVSMTSTELPAPNAQVMEGKAFIRGFIPLT